MDMTTVEDEWTIPLEWCLRGVLGAPSDNGLRDLHPQSPSDLFKHFQVSDQDRPTDREHRWVISGFEADFRSDTGRITLSNGKQWFAQNQILSSLSRVIPEQSFQECWMCLAFTSAYSGDFLKATAAWKRWTGSGISESAPLTLFQTISFNSNIGVRS